MIMRIVNQATQISFVNYCFNKKTRNNFQQLVCIINLPTKS